jgi:hypothetical protein
MEYYSPQEILSWNKEYDFFTSSFGQDDEILLKGLHLPLPVRGNRLVWGFSLAERALHLGIEKLACKDFKDSPELELLKLALLLENRAGFYSWPEKEKLALFIAKYNLQAAAGQLAVLIENKRDAQFLERINSYRSYPAALKVLLDENLIDFKTAQKINPLPEVFFTMLLDKRNDLTFSERRMICVYVFELIQRDRLTLRQARTLIQDLFSESELLKRAFQLRYPQLAALEKRFIDFKEKYLKTSGIRLEAPPYFEGSDFTLQFSFADKKHFGKRLQKLNQLKENIDELFTLLQ